MVSPTVIRAYIRLVESGKISRESLELKLAAALSEMEEGVQVTSVSFEGGSQSGQVQMSPAQIVEMLEAVLSAIDGDNTVSDPVSVGIFSGNRLET